VGVLKFLCFFVVAFAFMVHHQLVSWIIKDEERRLRYFLKSIQFTSKLGLKILNVKVKAPPEDSAHGNLLISNHLSYVDVIVLFSRYPSLFVTSVEMGEVFFLGKMTKLAGCFFVERRKHLRSEGLAVQEREALKEKMREGFNVFLFPEGTSSDGSTVLPFKSNFFQTSLDLKQVIKPKVLKYDNLQKVAWYGEMTFPDHLYGLCQEKEIRVEIQALGDLDPAHFEDKFSFAKFSHQSIKGSYEAC
jgi:lyso-ornithine lipid O-acyltransferase